MAAVAAIIGIIGTIASVAGSIYKGQQEKKAEKKQAEYAKMVAEEKAQQLEKRKAAALGIMQARIGASGVDPETGSPLLVKYEEAKRWDEDIAAARREGAMRAGIHEEYAESAETSSFFSAGTTLLTGGSAFLEQGSDQGWW